MFTGFPQETISFFLDLRFHNNTTFFREQHDRYLAEVQKPFYAFIDALAPTMRDIDPRMELKPYKCLAHIHRDTRFSKDKSPYRDHLWICFRRAAEPKEGSVNFFFELGPSSVGWGVGTWGENKLMNERLRRQIAADPHHISSIIDSCDLAGRHMAMFGQSWKRMEVPENVPARLKPWYTMRDLYVARTNIDFDWSFTDRIFHEVRSDFEALAPIYRLLRGIQDDMIAEDRAAAIADQPRGEW